ncbi:MAG: hypothetical protein CMM52_15760 [Rhodospirillaceae bacterium]|nr:hypothetical protein [Rhodospirillaceae bacterium]|tara:strand:- start:27143 stop:27613 length:471 start_codon:yes stop_codon:yes gene_type:complete
MKSVAACLCSLTALIFLSCGMTGAKADFAAGAKAYDGGDYAKAYSEWKEAAQSGDLAAMVALADLYRRGAGRSPNIDLALHWYKQAAKAGDAIAQINLAEMYLNGWGTLRNLPLAWVWFNRAAKQGNAWAMSQRQILERVLSPSALATAKKMRNIR